MDLPDTEEALLPNNGAVDVLEVIGRLGERSCFLSFVLHGRPIFELHCLKINFVGAAHEVTELALYDRGIQSLSDVKNLHRCTALTSLNLHANGLTLISNLDTLTSL